MNGPIVDDVVVKATDLKQMGLPKLIVYETFAKVLQDERDARFGRGLDSKGKPLPPGRAKMAHKRGRWEPVKEDRSEGRARVMRQLHADYDSLGSYTAVARRWGVQRHQVEYALRGRRTYRRKHDGEDKNRIPASVFQQLRVLGGHREKPQPGVTWQGWDHEVRYGRDSGERQGEIYCYVWDTQEKFVQANYGAHPGKRTGQMLRDRKRLKIRAPKNADRSFVTMGFKGKATDNKPLWALLKEIRERKAKAEAAGKRPRKFPSSFRAALLQARGRSGLITDSSGAGWLVPMQPELQKALQVFSKKFLEQARNLPVKLVAPR